MADPASEIQDALRIYETEKKLQFDLAKFQFEQSKTFNTVIMGLAYGGFFALWSSANTFVSDRKTMALAGALMTVSILAFVLFTVLNMYVMSRISLTNAKLAQIFEPPKTAEDIRKIAARISEYRDKMNEDTRTASAKIAILWPPFFFTSLVAGLFAALLMLYIFLKHWLGF